MANMEEKRRYEQMGRGQRRMTNSSFSSISFEAESAIKFKKFAKTLEKTHTELLNELMKKIKLGDSTR